jgi:hypothetical protein
LLTSPSSEEELCDEKYRLSLCVSSGVVGRRVGVHRSRAYASVGLKTAAEWDNLKVVEVKVAEVKYHRAGYVEEGKKPPSMLAES